jgi:fructose-1,6-bisphosphatase/inositol monophosphatase family enzyme
MSRVDNETVAALIADAAATYILPRFNRLADGDIREKGPGDLVTIADLETEQALTPRLMDLLPGSLVVGEEAVAADPGVMDRLSGNQPVWLIDPVDGTANFAAGMPLFAVMVALVERGTMIASWIHDPVTGVMATAEAGAGAWDRGRRLSVLPGAEPASMSGAISVRFGRRDIARKVAGRSNQLGSVFSLRCAGQEYLALASGRAHFSLYHRLYPWDHVPGFLLHQEAGGYAKRLDGSPFTPRTHDGGLLLAPDAASWDALYELLLA